MSSILPENERLKPRMLSETDLASRWKVSRRTIQRWRTSGRLPTPFRIGRKVLFRTEDIDTFEALPVTPPFGRGDA